MNDNDLSELEANIERTISKLGYKLMGNKNGFDLCAKQNGTFKDRYLAIDFIIDDNVRADNVLNFLDKLRKYRKILSEEYTVGWSLEGIIYYTGELPPNIASLAESLKDSKLKFTFNKL